MRHRRYALTGVRIHQAADAETRLRELGLSISIMQNAMRAGLKAFLECTDDDPSVVRGMLLFGKIVRSLREQLKADGWEKETTRNLELTVQADGRVKLMVTRGTSSSGDPSGHPETKRERGQAVVDELRELRDGPMLPLPGLQEFLPQTRSQAEPFGERWILLYHRNQNVLNAELSSPYSIDKGTRISQWSERIILPRVVERPEPQVA